MYNEKLVRTALRYQAIFLDVNRESLNNSKFLTEPVVAFIKKLSDNGYTVSEELLHALSSVSKDELLAITAVIDDVYGVNLNWTPLVKHWDIPTGESYMDHLLTFFANILGGEEAGIPGTTLPCGHFIPEGTFPLERYNGCPFCGTQYKMDDLFPKITGFYFFDSLRMTKKQVLIGWPVCTAVCALVSIIFRPFLNSIPVVADILNFFLPASAFAVQVSQSDR